MWANQQHTAGRARERRHAVKTRGGSPATVSEYTYNGLGHRIGWHYDADTDADVDGSDPWYWFFYDERWRMVATYRGSDSNPKERFVYHNAGDSGHRGASHGASSRPSRSFLTVPQRRQSRATEVCSETSVLTRTSRNRPPSPPRPAPGLPPRPFITVPHRSPSEQGLRWHDFSMTSVPPAGETVRVCCVCVNNIITRNHDPVGIIQDCVSAHEQCRAFQGPDSSPESACNEIKCYQRQLECLARGRERCRGDQSCIFYVDRHIEQMKASMMYYFELCRGAF